MIDGISKDEESKTEVKATKQDKSVQTENISKHRYFKWDGTINFGNVLTILTIIVAGVSLLYQKKSVDAKVRDLQVVVDSLEQEKFVRELSNLEHESKIINGDTYNLHYTVTQLRAIQKIYDQQFIESITQLNDIFAFIEKQNKLSPLELANLEKVKFINEARREIYIHNLIYSQKTEDFALKYEPKKENFNDMNDYILALNKYNDTLRKNTNYLLGILDSLIKIQNKKIEQLTNKN